MGGDTYEPLTVLGISLNKEQVTQFGAQLKEEHKAHLVETYDDVDDLTPAQIFTEASFAVGDVCMHVLSDYAYSRWEGLDPSEYEEYCDVHYVIGVEIENSTSASELVDKEGQVSSLIAKNTFITGDVRLFTGIKC